MQPHHGGEPVKKHVVAKVLALNYPDHCTHVENHMTTTAKHDERMANMIFGTVYPMYVTKVEKKGRTQAELDNVIEWLTGFNPARVQQLIAEEVSFKTFFEQATLNPNAHLITGSICGYKVQDIENPLTQKVRYLDKLVDELAKGKKMEKILRSA
ncbi:MAG: DUF2200 domain-containing protein [Reinekea sp.]|nr:DUF2200 domain-containing protein [Reinekea sp.]